MRELITRTRRTNFCVNCSSELLGTDNFGSSDVEMGTRTGTGQSSLYESLSLVFNLKLLENVSPSSSLDLDLEVDNHPIIIEENSHYSENEAQPAHCCNPDPGAIINNTFKLDLNPMLCLNCSMVFDVLYQLFVEFSNLRTTGSYLTRKIKQVEDLFVVLLAQSSLASASASASASVAVAEAEAEAVKTGGGTPAATRTTTTTSASIIMESSESIIMSTPTTSDPTPMEVILLEPEPPKIMPSENEDTDEIMISNLNFQELTMSTSDPVAQIPIPIPIDLCSVLEPVQPAQPTSIIAFDLVHMEDSSVRGILSDDETSSIHLDLDMFGGSDSGISAVDDLSVSDDIFKEIYFEAPGNNNDSNAPSINFHSTSSSTSSSLSSEDSYTNALNEVLIPPLQLQPSASLQTQQNQNQQNDNCVHFDDLEVDNFEHFSFASSSSCLNENDLTEAQQNNISIKIKTDNNKDTEDDNDVDVAMKQFFIPPLSILSPGIGTTTTGISEAASPSPSSTSSTTSAISSTSSYLGKLLPFQAVQEAYPTDNELEEFKQSSLQPPFLCPKPKCNKKRFLHVTNYLRHVRTHLHMFRFKCPSASTCPHPYKNYKSLKEHCEKYHDCTPLPPSSNSSASSSASSKTFISRRGPRPPFKYQLFPTKTSPGTIKAILTTFTQSGLQGADGDWTSIFDSSNSQTQIETKGEVEVDANFITSPELEFSTKIENESTTTATTTTTILTIINCDLERSIHLRNGSLNTVLPFPQCEPFNCPCPSSTSSPDPANNDKDHEGSPDRTNQICPETYKTSKELTAHIRATHGKFEYLYKCPQCAKLYPKKTQIFNNHLPVCGKEKDKSKYKIYLPPYICQVCNQEFPKREKLLKHCRRFHSDKDFKCDQCSRGFKLKQDLNRHMVTHTNERGHICGDCGKSYKTLGNLKFHFKISHTEEGRLQYNQYSRLKNQRIKLAKRSAENEKLISN